MMGTSGGQKTLNNCVVQGALTLEPTQFSLASVILGILTDNYYFRGNKCHTIAGECYFVGAFS